MSNKSNKNKMQLLLAISAIAGAATVAAISTKKHKAGSKSKTNLPKDTTIDDRQVYFVGGGLASLAGAAYLVRDCNFKGENIHIIRNFNELTNHCKVC